MSAARVRLPRLTREEVGYRNAIAQAPATLQVKLGEGEWQLNIAPAQGAGVPNGALRLEADWGGALFDVELPADAAQRFLRHVMPDAELASLPESLRLAVLETLRADLERQLGAKSRRPLRLNAAAHAEGASLSRHRFAFTLTSARSGEAITGEVATDVAGLSYAAPLLRAATPTAATTASWVESLPIPLCFEAGSTTLDKHELAGAEVGDLVLLDECCLAPGGEMYVAVAPGLAFRAKLEGHSITVTQPLGPVMPEPATTAAKSPATADPGAAERIPVRLTFDLGERSMTLAELRDLKPGYTFDLGRDLRRAVSIRAHGQVIGEGELVEIDGTLGVAITSLAPAAKQG